MPAGVWAFGVDGIGNHADGGVHHGFLRTQKFLGFQRGGGAGGQCFDEAGAGGIHLAIFEQHQHAQQRLAAIQQRHHQGRRIGKACIHPQHGQFIRCQTAADTLQIGTRAGHCLRHRVRIQWWQVRRRFGFTSFHIQRRCAQLFTGCIGQVQQATARTGNVHQLVQQPRTQCVKIGLGGQAAVDPQKTPDRITHQIKPCGQLLDFTHRRANDRVIGEIKTAHGFCLMRQACQRCGNTPRHQQNEQCGNCD